MLEVAYSGARGRDYLVKGNPNEAPATVGVTNSNVNRPFATIAPALRDVGQVQASASSTTTCSSSSKVVSPTASRCSRRTRTPRRRTTSDNDGAVATVANV